MIVYTGHPVYEFIYESRERGSAFGQFVGTCRGWGGAEVLYENCKPGGIGPLLDTLKAVESTGLGIDGGGVFHGTYRRSIAEIIAEITADSADVFGEYPKNLKKQSKIVPVDGNIRSRHEFADQLRQLIRHATSEMQQRLNGRRHWEGVNSEIDILIDRYFKEVPS